MVRFALRISVKCIDTDREDGVKRGTSKEKGGRDRRWGKGKESIQIALRDVSSTPRSEVVGPQAQ